MPVWRCVLARYTAPSEAKLEKLGTLDTPLKCRHQPYVAAQLGFRYALV